MSARTVAALALLLALVPGAPGSAAAAGPAPGPRVVVDDFDAPERWTAMPADGVEMRLSSDAGADGTGRSLRVDFRFVKGGGYAVLHRAVDLELPENYRFTFRLRGECPSENLEFKLADSSGANVWWRNQRDLQFPRAWATSVIRRRQIEFAWGPAGGGVLRRAASLEFAITAGSGGSGTVWLDDLALEPLPPTGAPAPLVATATSARGGRDARFAVDGSRATAWVADWGDSAPALTLDLGGPRELGGLALDRARDARATPYAIDLSDDGTTWRTVRDLGGARERDAVDLPETETRYVRLRRAGGARGALGFGEVRVMPLDWSASPAAFARAVAREAPRGAYPRGILGEPTAWAVVGVDNGRAKGLLGSDGALETGRGAFSIEPFLWDGGRLVSWAEVKPVPSLEEGELPIPSVTWRRGDLELTVTAFADGPPDTSVMVARYRVRNLGGGPLSPTLYLALRPFQVNPPEQFLGVPGGVAPVRALFEDGQVIRVNGDRGVISLTQFSDFGAVASEDGDVVADYLRENHLPGPTHAADSLGRASGALAYRLQIDGGAEQEVDLLVPLAARPWQPDEHTDREWESDVARRLEACRQAWRSCGRSVAGQWNGLFDTPFSLRLPADGAEVARALASQLNWIRVNRVGGGIQPGSRAYNRSWIRDGSLTSAALLRTGHPEVVRDFIDWFAGYQYADGKVPCCVDQRGSDPVPENDSDGEFIWLVAEYFRHTLDGPSLQRHWPAVERAAAHLDSLRRLRRTPEWRARSRGEFYGLLPPSISHEGYSAQPMHSYWDDLFALRGFRDAAYLAQVVDEAAAPRWAAVRDTFERDLLASIRTAMAVHGIDYVPGCADLGDFDATSTTIALDPVQAGGIPRAALARTFERYWEFFRDRASGAKPFDAFTPYEMRTIGAFARLGWRERADSLLTWFMKWRRPPGWQQWPEVGFSDPRSPRFLGDLPHTWVGSDFVRSVLDLFAYRRESDSTVVIAAGVPLRWAMNRDGLAIHGLHLDRPNRPVLIGYTMEPSWDGLQVRFDPADDAPALGVEVRAPGKWRTITWNGKPVSPEDDGSVRLLNPWGGSLLFRP